MGKGLEKLQTAWHKLGKDDQVFFLQYFIEDTSSPFFLNAKSITDSPYGPTPDLCKAASIFTQNLDMAVADLQMPRGVHFQGNPENFANKWLARYLLDYWAQNTGEIPRKYEDNPAIRFVEKAVNELAHKYWDEESAAAIELKAFTNVYVTCGQIIDLYPSPKEN